MIRDWLRRLAAFAARWRLRCSGRRVGLVLVYHQVGRDPAAGAAGPVQMTARGDFAAHMRHLRRAYRVVPGREVAAAAGRRRWGGRLPVAVTLDDDLPSHEQVVMPILAELGVPATFFVGGRGLAELPELWWETLQRGLEAGVAEDLARELGIEPAGVPADGSLRWLLAERVMDLSPGAREAWRESLSARLGASPRPVRLGADQLRALAAAGFELGFHTLRHENLLQLDDRDLDQALIEGRDALVELAGGSLTAIAYPYGRVDDRVAGAARRQGYRFGFTAEEEWVTPATDVLRIGRVEPMARSSGSFALELTRRLREGG